MRTGDVVRSSTTPLRSGAEYYAFAVCMSVEPFVLVSEEGDMVWRRLSRGDFIAIGRALWPTRLRCRWRLIKDRWRWT